MKQDDAKASPRHSHFKNMIFHIKSTLKLGFINLISMQFKTYIAWPIVITYLPELSFCAEHRVDLKYVLYQLQNFGKERSQKCFENETKTIGDDCAKNFTSL